MFYKEEIVKAMTILGKDKRTIFLGQSIVYPGHIMFNSLEKVSMSKRIELPVFEEVQMGISIGLSLEGFIPISLFPRIDFLIVAMNQLVNHLDKLEEMSCGRFKPKVIIRTMIGRTKPFYSGAQHIQDHTQALIDMTTNIDVVKFMTAREIVPAYEYAMESDKSSILIEVGDLYEFD